MFVRVIACAAIWLAAVSTVEAQPRQAAAIAAATQRPISFAAAPGAQEGVLVLPLSAAADLATRGATLNETERAAITRAIEADGFKFAAAKTLSLRGIGAWSRILVVGLGENPTASDLQDAGAVTGRTLLNEKSAVTVFAGGLPASSVTDFATGLGLGEYRSDTFQAARRNAAPLATTTIVTDATAEAAGAYGRRGRALIDAMAWTRDVSNQPANIIYPESFVASARRQFAGVAGVTIEVLDVRAMERLGMGAMIAVGQGSARPPQMLIVRYRGPSAPTGGPIVLAGKGITFDSGGLSLKDPGGMGNMRMDMSGAASVTGAVLALARAQAPVHVIAIAALAENMPDGAAFRPGDVITAMNGKTIEIVSTDAEGRLVLADALAYAGAHLAPAVVVDVATLTGSVRGALGDEYAGLFTRQDALAAQLAAAGDAVGEQVWRLPLHDSYAKDMASTYADLKSQASEGGAGASTGAWFIGEFISRDIPWAHLDIANVA